MIRLLSAPVIMEFRYLIFQCEEVLVDPESGHANCIHLDFGVLVVL